MIDITALRTQISDILHRFPSVTGEIRRRTLDSYGQPTDTETVIAQEELWWRTPDTGDKWAIAEKGQTFSQDNARWVCALLTDDTPDVKRGDVIVIGGETWRVANIQPRLARVFWQLVPEGGE